MSYNVDYFLKKFEAIPEERMIAFFAADNNGNHCALGWCRDYANPYIDKFSDETRGLIQVFSGIKSPTSPGMEEKGWAVADVNNGIHPDYQQPTAKQRVLAALRDIKQAEEAVKQAEAIIQNPVEVFAV